MMKPLRYTDADANLKGKDIKPGMKIRVSNRPANVVLWSMPGKVVKRDEKLWFVRSKEKDDVELTKEVLETWDFMQA